MSESVLTTCQAGRRKGAAKAHANRMTPTAITAKACQSTLTYSYSYPIPKNMIFSITHVPYAVMTMCSRLPCAGSVPGTMQAKLPAPVDQGGVPSYDSRRRAAAHCCARCPTAHASAARCSAAEPGSTRAASDSRPTRAPTASHAALQGPHQRVCQQPC